MTDRVKTHCERLDPKDSAQGSSLKSACGLGGYGREQGGTASLWRKMGGESASDVDLSELW